MCSGTSNMAAQSAVAILDDRDCLRRGWPPDWTDRLRPPVAAARSPPVTDTPSIKAEDVSLTYRLPGYGAGSLKELAVRVARGRKAVESIQALLGVDLEVLPGEVVAIIGANGAGKSSLMKLLARVAPTYRGTGTCPRPCVAHDRARSRIQPRADGSRECHPLRDSARAGQPHT